MYPPVSRRAASYLLVTALMIVFASVTSGAFAAAATEPGGEGGTTEPGGVGRLVRIPNLLGSENLIEIVNRVIDAVWPLATVAVMVMVLWAAYILLFSGGVPARIQRAKDTLLWTIVGYAIIWLAKGIAFIVQDILTTR